jgi:hypothetical protein
LHPNACLKNIRNVKSGLAARSKILSLLDNGGFSASRIAKETALSYGVVRHHLGLLEKESVVKRSGSKRFVWVSTGLGQKRLA